MKHAILFSAVFLCSILASATAEGTDGLPICIDTKSPEAPTGLTLVGNILQWNEAEDIPECSGIAYYEIYRNDVLLNRTSQTSYTVNAKVGDSFKVIAFDLANNSGTPAEYTVPAPPPTGGGSGSSGSGGGGSSSGGGSTGGTTIIPETTQTTSTANTTNTTGTKNQTGEENGKKQKNETTPMGETNSTLSNSTQEEPQAPAQLGFTPYTMMVGVLFVGLLSLAFMFLR